MSKPKEKWEVEWTTDCESDGFGGHDPDTGTEHVEEFNTKVEAVAFAKTKIEADYWGCPRVSLLRRVVTDPDDGGPVMVDWDTVETVDVTTV